MSDGIVEPDMEEEPQTNYGFDGMFEGNSDLDVRGTLDEHVFTTLKRDLDEINGRLKQVVYPYFPTGSWTLFSNDDVTYKYTTDLWAPLLFTILQSVLLSRKTDLLFSNVFVLNWGVLTVMATHIKLIHVEEPVSWLTNVSIGGYCLFPLVVNSFLGTVVYPAVLGLLALGKWQLRSLYILRIVTFGLYFVWSYTAMCIVSSCEGIVERYPVALCYFILGCLSVIF